MYIAGLTVLGRVFRWSGRVAGCRLACTQTGTLQLALGPAGVRWSAYWHRTGVPVGTALALDPHTHRWSLSLRRTDWHGENRRCGRDSKTANLSVSMQCSTGARQHGNAQPFLDTSIASLEVLLKVRIIILKVFQTCENDINSRVS